MTAPPRPPLARRLAAEFIGAMLLVTAVVGSGIAASRLSPDDVGLQLLQNSLATMLALGVLILVFGPVSGAHFNPVITVADWWLHRRSGQGPTSADTAGYVAAQLAGGIGGAVLANLMFSLAPVSWSRTERAAPNLWLGEILATAGLVLLAFTLVRTNRTNLAPAAVGAYIGAAYWFTSSTSFANPAVTIGRAFTDTFAGIQPASVAGFVAAQLVGALVGILGVAAFYPHRTEVPAGTAAIEVRNESSRPGRDP